MEKEEKRKLGRKSRLAGQNFEKLTRKNLENKGWLVFKNQSIVDLENNKLVPSKPKFNPFTKSLMMNSGGMPDFICIKEAQNGLFEVQFVESKMNGILDKEEKSKVSWIKEQLHIPVIVASKDNKEVKYDIQ